MRIEMSGFDEFEREIKRQTQAALAEYARDFERQMNNLSRTMKGQPLSLIKSRLRSTLSDQGGSITEPDLTEYAEAIQAGTTFHMKAGDLRL